MGTEGVRNDESADGLLWRWHDDLIYGLSFEIGDPDLQDWRSDLVFDIDFISEWLCEPGGNAQFRVAPAKLVFHDVTDLSIAVAQEDSNGRTALNEWSIDRVLRERLDRPFDYWRWTIQLNMPAGGRIMFCASRYSQTLRAEPRLLAGQHLSRSQRQALLAG